MVFDLITPATFLKRLKAEKGISRSPAWMSQMIKEGNIPTHAKQDSPKKFVKFDEAFKAMESTKDPTRDAQREANEQKRNGEDVDLFAAAGTYPSEADMDPDELAKRREEERIKREAAEAKKEALAEGAGDDDTDIPESITIAGAKAEKEYWLGLKAKHQVQELTKQLIPIDDAKAAFEVLLSPVNKSLDDLGVNFKAHFPEVPSDAVEWLIGYVNDTKEALREYKWES